MAFTLARLGAAVLLLIAVGRNPYDFYTIMRWVVCGVCTYGAFVEFERNRTTWAWLFVIMAVAFNPIVPVRLTRETWAPIDVLAAGILVASVLASRKRKGIHR
ncbi:MAG: DUF6804 family protein [Vicinamibacterales bacterium]